jgi:saccharopine dehydrogenase (NAD+, L-lysine forming)
MGVTIGIRREDKSDWERRAPLIPRDLVALEREQGLKFIIQPSPIRVITDEEYRAAGLTVSEDLSVCSVILAIKEIPARLLQAGKAYVYFSHVVKGQPYNMPMLGRLLELGCSLVDYEKIADDQNRRLVFFSRHAGYAGMLETLWCLGQRLKWRGIASPFSEVRHAYGYADLEAAKDHLRDIGARIVRHGLPEGMRPLVIGVAGYGNVAQGVQEILECLPLTEISPAELAAAAVLGRADGPALLKVLFREEHMARPTDPNATFQLQDYYQRPERYLGCFERHLPYLDVLVNTIYWEERYPRLVTREWAMTHYLPGRRPRLQVIGDISCDIEGSIELTLRATQPASPCFTYDPVEDTVRDGVEGHGPVIMAVDNLPCELSLESSQHFSTTLRGMVTDLAAADWSADFARLNLPPHLKKAVIVHRGELTPAYGYLRHYVEA